MENSGDASLPQICGYPSENPNQIGGKKINWSYDSVAFFPLDFRQLQNKED